MPQKDGRRRCRQDELTSRRPSSADRVDARAVERRDDQPRAGRETTGTGADRIASRAGGHRRHRREVRERRRGVAQADRFQERPGALHDVRRRAARRSRLQDDYLAGELRDQLRRPLRTSAGSRRWTSTRCWRASWRPRRRSSSLSTHGVSGSAAPAELETALQLLYLDFTAPGDDPEAFALMRRQLDAAVANRGRQSGPGVRREGGAINTSNHYTSEPLTAGTHCLARSARRC